MRRAVLPDNKDEDDGGNDESNIKHVRKKRICKRTDQHADGIIDNFRIGEIFEGGGRGRVRMCMPTIPGGSDQ